MADMNCLNNESGLDCMLDSEAELASEMENVVEVSKSYKGSETGDIIVSVDEATSTISAELQEEVKNKLDSIPKKVSELENDSNYATEEYVNSNGGKIDKILVNGTEQAITDKAVDISVPTKLTQLTNDAGFIDNAVSNLVNYYSKNQTLTKEEVLALVSQIPKFSVQVVSTLPSTDISSTTIYLLAVTGGDSNNYYEEYIYINGSWEIIGTTQIDLTDYVKKTDYATKETFGTVRVWKEDDYLCISTEPLPTGPVLSRIFSENTPEGIAYASADISAKNMTSAQVTEVYGWNLGDTIPITLTTGEVIQMQIIGINHDDKSDGSGKAGITLQMVECLATRYPMNSSNTNAGGYAASVMKTSTLPTIKALLPQEWQDVIKLVDKKSANGGSSNYSETLTLSEDIFLLAEIEVFGTTTYAQDGANEGSVYEYWNGKAAADRIKKYDTDADGVADTATHWWLRSSYYSSTSSFCLVNAGGIANPGVASFSRGVAFGFCI